MATNFPGSADDNTTLPNPGAGSFTNNPSHASIHDNANDAIKAIEAKVGTGASTPSAGKVFRGTSAGVSSWGALDLTTDVTGTLPVANGGTGVTSKTGTSLLVLNTSPTLVTPFINSITGSNAKTVLAFTDGASTVNNLRVTASNTTVAPQLSAEGSDTNIPLNLVPKGNEVVQMAGVPIDPTNSFYNGIINGGCMVGQRTAPSLSTTYQYGGVDRFACKATGTAVSAGTITQNTSPNAVSNGYVLKVAGATITGTGIVYARYRMESKDAMRFKNTAVSFSVLVYHDVGSSVNYTIFVNKATVADNFTATTAIANSGAIAVATGSATKITFENINSGNIGDITNGLEIEIQIACGAVTTKNFEFGEFQLNKGVHAFPYRPREYALDYLLSRRYYQRLVEPHYGGGTGGSTTALSRFGGFWPVELRTSPTVTLGSLPLYDLSTTYTINTGGSITHYSTALCFEVDCTSSSNFAAGARPVIAYIASSGAALIADAEL